MTVHLLKLCVGTNSVEELLAWHREQPSLRPDGNRRHVTRMWPKRAAEVLDGGSLYWVMGGRILARQRIVALEPVEGADGIHRCGIILDPKVIRTEPVPKRPFQGWRYLSPADAPRDLSLVARREDYLPPGLAEALAEFGVR